MGNHLRVLKCIRGGAETASDVWADLGYTVSKPLICAHLRLLKRRGRIRATGTRLVPFERRNGVRGRARVLTYTAVTPARLSA